MVITILLTTPPRYAAEATLLRSQRLGLGRGEPIPRRQMRLPPSPGISGGGPTRRRGKEIGVLKRVRFNANPGAGLVASLCRHVTARFPCCLESPRRRLVTRVAGYPVFCYAPGVQADKRLLTRGGSRWGVSVQVGCLWILLIVYSWTA